MCCPMLARLKRRSVTTSSNAAIMSDLLMVGRLREVGELEVVGVGDRTETPRMERRPFDRVAQERTQPVPLMGGQPIGRPLKPLEVCRHAGLELGADTGTQRLEIRRGGRHHGELQSQKVNRTAS